ncbi:hypothetical protein [Leucobacter chromiireducens]|uniref:hypothetical protein n=1 Tax=Leucobacter chromiireducens TaxID=283877 RepID=UPI003F810C4F
MIEFVSNRYLFMEVAPWVLPVGGSIIISNFIGPNLAWFWVGVGSLTVLVGTVPLGIRAYFQKHVAQVQLVKDARERASLRIVSSLVPKLPQPSNLSAQERAELRDETIKKVVESLASGVYPKKYGYRVTFYILGQDTDGTVQIKPIYSYGRDDVPGTHAPGSATFDALLEHLTGPFESASRAGIKGREYTSYSVASVSRDDEMYGILAVDTDSTLDLSVQDEENLVPIADLLASFFSAASIQKGSKNDSVWLKPMYAVINMLCRKGDDNT